MMRASLLCAAIVLVFLSTAAADRVTTDPNMQPAKQVSAPAADTRMSQKITYFSGFTRLHYITEEIAKRTGATIRCGKDPNDWPVRDLPLTVCANDIPADKLLRAIADATHTLLTISRVGGVHYYKVWKDPKREKLLQQSLDRQRKYNEDKTRWAWDALTKLKDIPDSAFEIDLTSDDMRQWMAGVREIGAVIQHLDKSCLERGLAGETFYLTFKDLSPAARNALSDHIRKSSERNKDSYRKLAEDNPNRGWHVGELSDEDVQRSYVSFRQFGGLIKNLGVFTGFASSPSEEGKLTPGGGGGQLQHYAGMLERCKDPRLTPALKYPDLLAECRFEKDIGNPELKLLDKDSDWDIPLLKTSADPERPKDKTDLVYADALKALSKASGCSIICEDFLSFRRRYDVSTIIGHESSIAEMLKAQTSNRWLVDEQSRLIVGWDKWWCEGQWRTIPESMLANLQTKLDTTGVEIDDATPFAKFSREQLELWLLDNRGCEGARQLWTFGVIDPESKLWEVYDSLSPADKALAKSDAGFPLGKLDTKMLSDLFKQINVERLSYPDYPDTDQAAKQKKYGLPSDPDQIALLTMKLEKHRPEYIMVPENGNTFPTRPVQTPPGFDKHEYRLKIQGENTDLTFGGLIHMYFPAYSPKREAEIEKAKQEKNAKQAPKTNSAGVTGTGGN